MLTKTIENINDWLDYVGELTQQKGNGTYHKNEPEEFPFIVVSSFRKKRVVDDVSHEKVMHKFYEHKFIYPQQAERLLSYV